MGIPFEPQPVRTVDTPGGAAELLQEMREDALPVYAIRRKKVSQQTAWNGFKRMAVRSGLILSGRCHELTFAQDPDCQTNYHQTSDFSIHLDGSPLRSSFAANVIQAHQALRGAYRALFFEITQQYAELASDPTSPFYGTRSRLPLETEELLDGGLVDPTVLQPEGYCHDGEPGDIVVFRVGGRSPVAHRFVTTEYPRVSQIIAYTPNAAERM